MTALITPVCYGIDLGTTNSCLSIYYKDPERKRSKNPDFPTSTSDHTLPSVVCFDDNEPIVGRLALQKREMFPKSTFYCVKRIIGKFRSDPRIEKDIANFTYDVDKDDNDRVRVHVPSNKRFPETYLYPE